MMTPELIAVHAHGLFRKDTGYSNKTTKALDANCRGHLVLYRYKTIVANRIDCRPCFLALDIARGVSSVEIGIGVSAPSIFYRHINKNCNKNCNKN
jgi:hypothetical protein